jgi:hypothetical protein
MSLNRAEVIETLRDVAEVVQEALPANQYPSTFRTVAYETLLEREFSRRAMRKTMPSHAHEGAKGLNLA